MIFLVDAKLVVLHSSTSDGDLKYDMRVIAHNVEYFDLMRDQGSLGSTPDHLMPHSPFAESPIMNESYADRSLRDSLWYFDGMEMRCWMDVEDLLRSTSTENERELPQPISMTTDFYPTSIILSRALFLGVDVDLVQRRDFQFAFFRQNIRVCSDFSSPAKLTDDIRLSYFSLTFFVDVCPSLIRRPPRVSPSVTKLFRISRMPLRSFCTRSLMTKLICILPKMRSYRPSFLFCPRSPIT